MADGLVRTTSEPGEHDAAAQHIAEQSLLVEVNQQLHPKALSPHYVGESQNHRHAVPSLLMNEHNIWQAKRSCDSDMLYLSATRHSAPITVVQDQHLPRQLTRDQMHSTHRSTRKPSPLVSCVRETRSQ